MRPPICAICDKYFRDDEDIEGVHFKLSDEDIAFNKRFDEEGFCGHPAGFEWFCKKHLEIAKRFSHLTKAEAMRLILQNAKR